MGGDVYPGGESTVGEDGETVDPGLNQVAAVSAGGQEGGISYGRRRGKGVRPRPAFTAFGDKARTSSSKKSIKKHKGNGAELPPPKGVRTVNIRERNNTVTVWNLL